MAVKAGLDNSELLAHCIGRHGLKEKNGMVFKEEYEFMRLRQVHDQIHQTMENSHVHRPDGSVIEIDL